MAIKYRLLLIIIIFNTHFIFSQEAGYFIDTSLDTPKFFQHIYWSKEEFALFYEVLIQKEDGEYLDYKRESTENTFINVSLPPGKYRFNVLPYDLLGQTGQVSEWRVFEILTAFQPSLEEINPPAFYMDNYSERVLNVTGNNLFEETEIFLQGGGDSLLFTDKIVWDSNRVTLFFDDEKLIPGTYQIYLRNPGGLDSITDGFFVGYRRPLDFFIKLSWLPVTPVYGDIFELFGLNFYLTGAGLNLGAVTTKRSFFYFGFELSTSVYILNSAFNVKSNLNSFFDSLLYTNNGITASWIDISFNLMLRKYFLKKLMAVTFHSGGGFSFFNLNEENSNNNNAIIQLNLGLSYMIQILDIFHIETGFDFMHYYTSLPSGFIRLRQSIVWKF